MFEWKTAATARLLQAAHSLSLAQASNKRSLIVADNNVAVFRQLAWHEPPPNPKATKSRLLTAQHTRRQKPGQKPRSLTCTMQEVPAVPQSAIVHAPHTCVKPHRCSSTCQPHAPSTHGWLLTAPTTAAAAGLSSAATHAAGAGPYCWSEGRTSASSSPSSCGCPALVLC